MTVEGPATSWSDYWEGVAFHQHIFVVEARDYVDRLRLSVRLRPGDRVLDFGSGFGHVVELLAPSVASVGFWDIAARMRRATEQRTAALATAELVDLSGPLPAGAVGAFDLVLANSVVQYMAAPELAGWLPRWGALLAPGGRIVLSDIPSPLTSAAGELLGMLRFAARHGFLLRAIRDGLQEARRYFRSRASADLLRWTPDEFVRMVEDRGLTATVLPVNLTHRSERFSVVLQPS